jgi:hypothetical protein
VAALFTPTLVACLAITSAVHVAVYMLNTTLPLHMVAVGASKTQVGLLFSVGTGVSMVMRPLVGPPRVGLTVERISYAAGFHVAAGGALLELVLFVIAERRLAGRAVLPRPLPGV